MTGPTPRQAAAARDRAGWVAAWIVGVMAERDNCWEQGELISRAKADHIILERWYWTRAVQATGIRSVSIDVDGSAMLFFVLDDPHSV
jgi:hypothetical protein